jgi:hypothetical protein
MDWKVERKTPRELRPAGPRWACQVEGAMGWERDQIQSPHSTRRSFDSNAEVETATNHLQTDQHHTLFSLLSQVSSNTHLGGSASASPSPRFVPDNIVLTVLLPLYPPTTNLSHRDPRSSILTCRPPLPQILFDPLPLDLSRVPLARIQSSWVRSTVPSLVPVRSSSR